MFSAQFQKHPYKIITSRLSMHKDAVLTPEGLQGEKQFFKLLLISEIFNTIKDKDFNQDLLKKFDPNTMFYKAKMD